MPSDRTSRRLATQPAPTVRRRWPWWLAAGALLTALIVWFAPTIVARSPLRQQLVPLAAPQFACQVHIGSASLGWFSPIVLSDLVVTDPAGETIAEVRRIDSEKSLAGLLSDTSDLGRFDLTGPKLNVVLRSDGSNLQDALAPLLESSNEPTAPLGLSVRIVEGRIDVIDATTEQQLQLADIQLNLDKPLQPDRPLTVSLAGAVEADSERGAIQADMVWTPPADAGGGSLGQGEIKFVLDQMMLSAVRPVLARFVPGMQLAGRLSSKLTCQFGGTIAQPTVRVVGDTDLRGLALAAPSWLGPDTLQADQITLQGRWALSDSRLVVENTQLASHMATMEISGSASLAHLAEKPWLSWVTGTLMSEEYRVAGQIDLAQLARMLPHTLRIREGTDITSGQVRFSSAGFSDEGNRQWTGTIETQQLAGTANGRPVAWERPIEVSFAARDADGAFVVDELRCRASFLDVAASGTLRDANVSVSGDLDQLTQELNRFFDLGSTKMAGTLGGQLTCRLDQDHRLATTGKLDVDRLLLSLPGGHTLSEPRLAIEFAASGLADPNGTSVERIDAAKATVVAGRDRAEIEFTQPVERPSAQTTWPLAVRASGELSTWLARFRDWVPLDGWEIAGQADVQAVVAASPAKITVRNSNITLNRLHAHGHGLYVDEPRARLQVTGSWSAQTRQLTAPLVSLTTGPAADPDSSSPAVDVRAQNLAVTMDETGLPGFSADVEFRGELGRLMQWMTDPRSQPTQFVNGRAEVKSNISYGQGKTRAQGSAVVNDLVYATLQTAPAPAASPLRPATAPAAARWETVWSEQQVSLQGKAGYDHQADGLYLHQLELTSDAVRLAATGKINALTGNRVVNLQGEIEYDLPRLTARLAPLIGPDVTLDGSQKRTFFVRGPLVFYTSVSATALAQSTPASFSRDASARVMPETTVFEWPRQLSGSAGFGWSSADIYGLKAGKGSLEGRLTAGVVSITPLDLTVSGGRIHMAPRILVGKTPMLMVVDRGRAMENMQITDQMCHTWLQYVAPMFAEATRIDGRFSLDLDSAQVPLAAPKTGNAAGTLHLQSAKLRPGPLLDRFVYLTQRIQAVVDRKPVPTSYTPPQSGLVELEPQSVPFQMVKGRVYHRDLTINVRGVRIRTSGSVGLDQTLALVAEVPIQEAWIGRDNLLASLRGQTLQIPVGGRLDQPQLDDRVLQQLGRQVLDEAAGRLIEQGVDRALNGLFGQ